MVTAARRLECRVQASVPGYEAMASVGIRDGQIVTITSEAITGAETIDAMEGVLE